MLSFKHLTPLIIFCHIVDETQLCYSSCLKVLPYMFSFKITQWLSPTTPLRDTHMLFAWNAVRLSRHWEITQRISFLFHNINLPFVWLYIDDFHVRLTYHLNILQISYVWTDRNAVTSYSLWLFAVYIWPGNSYWEYHVAYCQFVKTYQSVL